MIDKPLMNAVRLSCIAILYLFSMPVKGQAHDISLKIHLAGVAKSKISILSLAGSSIKTIVENPGINNGETTLLKIPEDKLPGEFVLRFDYQEKESSNPYPAEKHIFVSDQNLELWARPKALNQPDSTYFQKDERENSLFARFSADNGKKREQLAMLQNFLISYDQPESKLFLLGTEEYENRRLVYNKWIAAEVKQHQTAFVSNGFVFQHIPPMVWKGSEPDRVNGVIEHYFDGMDFKNPLIIKTTDIKEWINKYVNIYGAMSTTVALRDSLFTLAGKRAIEKARLGHPLVYGWMVDYFYNGFETFNISVGIKMLEPYLNDPLCLTNKRKAIAQRLKGMETLVVGSVAPDFSWKLNSGKMIAFHHYKTEAKYKLVLFWSADCHHCKALMEKLYPWYQEPSNRELMDVFAISLDETETEILAWEKEKTQLTNFKHKRAEQGIRSPEANAYFVLSTPTMILVDSKTNTIVALPDTVTALQKEMK
ncbi:redoxin domain-containing protein [Flavobacterium sp. LB2P84]|uniref:redoxin domain-containing protein n=1 Tax=Flavobacterium yafengii TaxID=3041253 RepID=UPI0024A7CE0F|nr:redoxin domain-containing protein [Flavobacterium yafengii]MDI6033756.1 redoxin domain-containing protein [Flavobacterium yafengii]